MKKEESTVYKFESLTDFHRVFGLAKPKHPLISFFAIKELNYKPGELPPALIMDFYKIAFKTNLCGKAKYGQAIMILGRAAWCSLRQVRFLKVRMVRLLPAICC